MTAYKIALLDGDGIGPEIMAEAVKILDLVGKRNNIEFDLQHGAFGAHAYFDHGHSFPEATKATLRFSRRHLEGAHRTQPRRIKEDSSGYAAGTRRIATSAAPL